MGIERFSFEGVCGEVVAASATATLEENVRRLIDPTQSLETLHWGRNYLYKASFPGPGGQVEVVVKQFRDHGLGRRLSRRWRGSNAERSWKIAHALSAAGFLTPKPVLFAESTGSGGPSFYVCRYLGGALEARYLLRAMNAGREPELYPDIDVIGFLHALGRLVRRLHEARFWYRDMSSGNVLLKPRQEASRSPFDLYLVDTNRVRAGRRLTKSERTRDLCRLPIFRPGHQEVFLDSYWGRPHTRPERALYLTYHRGLLWKNRSKDSVRRGLRRLQELLLTRRPHVHIPPPAADASPRDKTVWDPLSDQPHQHARLSDKLAIRLADATSHLQGGLVVAGALPGIMGRYRTLKRDLYSHRVPWGGAGVCLGPRPEDPESVLRSLEELGLRRVLLRLHPWEREHGREETLARELHRRGYDLAFALPQSRDLVRGRERWRAAIEEIAERFTPFGRHFQVGQAINRSKWGIWKHREYVELARVAEEILRRNAEVEILGPAVIDFEYHVTALVLNLPDSGLRFDVVSSLLYVDRRGPPENRQLGFDTVDKVVLLKAIAETSRNSSGRCWITEVNWPLWEGPHSPAGREVAVDEERQANYLARYFLLALGTGLVERVYWWQLVAKGYGLIDPVDGRALRRRASYRALATMARELKGSEFLGPLPSSPTSRLYLFRRGAGSELVAGWTLEGRGERVSLPRPPAAAISRDGEKVEIGGTGEVTLTPSPTYFFLSPI